MKLFIYVFFMLAISSPYNSWRVLGSIYSLFIPSSVFYPLIRVLSPICVLSPHPCFISSSVFYPLIRVLSPHPCFVPSSVFYPLIRVLSRHPCFIPSSVFYLPVRVLSPRPCFIPPSVFYPPIRVLSPHPCFIPSSVSVSVPSVFASVSVFFIPTRENVIDFLLVFENLDSKNMKCSC